MIRKTKRLELTADAKRDLKQIKKFIQKNSIVHAEQFVGELSSKIRWIADVDFTGVPRGDIAPGMRALPYKDRCIYFKSYPDRILHGAQDIESQSFSED